jgi:hypothetical protein
MKVEEAKQEKEQAKNEAKQHKLCKDFKDFDVDEQPIMAILNKPK